MSNTDAAVAKARRAVAGKTGRAWTPAPTPTRAAAPARIDEYRRKFPIGGLERRIATATAKPARRPAITRAAGGKTLTGYAAVFYKPGDAGTEFELGPGLVERIKPEAFDDSIARGDDVVALFNHRIDHLLGRTSAGTVKLRVDSIGLRYEVKLPDTQTARDVAALAARGDLNASSFAFTVDRQRFEAGPKGGSDVRWLEAVTLRDVSPVVSPAYVGTSTSIGN